MPNPFELEFQDEAYEHPNRVRLMAIHEGDNLFDVQRETGDGTPGTALNAAFFDGLREWVNSTYFDAVDGVVAAAESAAIMATDATNAAIAATEAAEPAAAQGVAAAEAAERANLAASRAENATEAALEADPRAAITHPADDTVFTLWANNSTLTAEFSTALLRFLVDGIETATFGASGAKTASLAVSDIASVGQFVFSRRENGNHSLTWQE